MKKVGYMRVGGPRGGARIDRQLDVLIRAGVATENLYVDLSPTDEATGLRHAIDSIEPGDTLVVTDPARLGRDLGMLQEAVGQVRARGGAVESLDGSLGEASATIVLDIIGSEGVDEEAAGLSESEVADLIDAAGVRNVDELIARLIAYRTQS